MRVGLNYDTLGIPHRCGMHFLILILLSPASTLGSTLGSETFANFVLIRESLYSLYSILGDSRKFMFAKYKNFAHSTRISHGDRYRFSASRLIP